MTLQFGDFKEMALRNLKAEADTTYPDELIWDGLCGALDAVLPWRPRANVAALVATSETNRIPLPEDLYQIDGVFDPDAGWFLGQMVVQARQSYRSSGAYSNEEMADWMVYPAGTLYLSRTIPIGKSFDLFYQAYWPKPLNADDDTFVIPTPDSMRNAVLYYTMGHCLLPSSAASSQIRQFNTRIDSGTPVDNVLEQAARYFRVLFVDEMNRQPKYTGGVG